MSEVLIDQLGGPEAVREIVADMYERVFRDPTLAGFFEGVDQDRLKRMQFEFISSALGGPLQYTGAELQAVHAGRIFRRQTTRSLSAICLTFCRIEV